MESIYIVDLIGEYCGMHYYDDAFVELLASGRIKSSVLSTYSVKNKDAFFPCIFRFNRFISIFLLVYCNIKFLLHIIKHPHSLYIYMSYGEFYDLPFWVLSLFNNRIVYDIHEVHALKFSDNSKVINLFYWVYRHCAHTIIYHSNRTFVALSNAKVKAKMIFVPHLNYTFKKEFDLSLVSNEVRETFNSNNIKFLFFGNLSIVKGIDTVISVFSNLTPEIREKVELVIAGKNVDFMNFEELLSVSNNYHVFDRHISDDELVYLYKKTDFILLPYKKSSQSGIFAMACYFRKPMLLSDIPYFRKMLSDYPSFGEIQSLDSFENKLLYVINNSNSCYFNQNDIDKFSQKTEFEMFLREIKKIISK